MHPFLSCFFFLFCAVLCCLSTYSLPTSWWKFELKPINSSIEYYYNDFIIILPLKRWKHMLFFLLARMLVFFFLMPFSRSQVEFGFCLFRSTVGWMWKKIAYAILWNSNWDDWNMMWQVRWRITVVRQERKHIVLRCNMILTKGWLWIDSLISLGKKKKDLLALLMKLSSEFISEFVWREARFT